jgi:curli biogenesis system outer membrane secretion channel CsgG
MLKTLSFVTAAALLASVTAFAQTPATTTTTTTTTPAATSETTTSSDVKVGKMHHHHHHYMRSAKNGGSDWDADKLNACMSNAMPTDAQENCLKQAERS